MHSLQKQLFNASALAGIVVVGLLLVTFRIAFFNSQLGDLASTVSDIRYQVMEQRYFLADGRYSDDSRLKEYLKSNAKFKELLFKFQNQHPEIAFRALDITNQSLLIHSAVLDALDITKSPEDAKEAEEGRAQLMTKLEPLFDDQLAQVTKMKKEIRAYQDFQLERLTVSIGATIIAALLLLLALAYMHSLAIRKFFEQFGFVSKRIAEGKFSIGKSVEWYAEIVHLVESFKELGGFEREKMEFVRSQLYDLEKFRSIVDNLNDGVVLMDADGFVIYVNQKLISQAGYTSQELIGQRPLHWRGEGAADKIKDIWRIVSREHGTFEGELPAISKLNHEYNAILKIFPILSHTKDLRFMVAVEKGLDQCIQVNGFGGEMPSIISHQIKAPLQTISMAIEMLGGKRSSMTKAEIIESAEFAIAHIKKVVDELMNSFKADGDRFNIKMEDVKLATVFKDIRKSMDQFVKGSKVDLSFSIPRSFPASIKADASILEEVLEVLVHNAITYSSKKRGGGEVKVVSKTENDRVVISVADNGIGIPESSQNLIFNPFYRAENALKLMPEGTGIGLYFAKKAIEAMGGKIEFESKEGKGALFMISLPMV